MVQVNSLFVTLAIVSVSFPLGALAAPMPLSKRISQTISDSTTKWVAACTAAGGGSQCNTISVNAFSTLLAAADNCAQQDSADQMITLAKSLNNDADMIKFAQIFAQQPRNTPTSQAVPYCQSAPTNSELNGLFQCQFQGASETTFVGGLAAGSAGTIPFGMTAAVSPAGSCPANPSGPIADGTQLVDQVDSPGTVSSSGSSSNSTSSASSGAASSASAVTSTSTAAASSSSSSAVSTSTSSTSSSSSSSSSTSSFALQNGEDAQSLNAQFATLSTDASCTDGENACVNGDFAQCVGGTYTTTACAASTSCFALPLVNSAGTSITCTTTSDAEARIAATGATGGITGDGSTSSSSNSTTATTSSAAAVSTATTATANVAAAAASSSSSSSSGFQLSNGQAAQALNKQFATLTTSSSCTDGENACVDGGFAQCVGGTFSTPIQCGASEICAALPLVNSAGTSVTCTTQSDAQTRIAATGATGGITGD